MPVPRPLFAAHTDPLAASRGRPGRPPTRRAAVLAAVREGAGPVVEIARATGLSPAVVRRALRWLSEAGFVRPFTWESV